jgi:hypothetical protein
MRERKREGRDEKMKTRRKDAGWREQQERRKDTGWAVRRERREEKKIKENKRLGLLTKSKPMSRPKPT